MESAGKAAPALQSATTKSFNQASIDSCVDQWSNAFHKESGEDALIMADMLDEWETLCKAGKHP